MHLNQTDFDLERLHAQLELTTHRDTLVIFKSSGDFLKILLTGSQLQSSGVAFVAMCRFECLPQSILFVLLCCKSSQRCKITFLKKFIEGGGNIMLKGLSIQFDSMPFCKVHLIISLCIIHYSAP